MEIGEKRLFCSGVEDGGVWGGDTSAMCCRSWRRRLLNGCNEPGDLLLDGYALLAVPSD